MTNITNNFAEGSIVMQAGSTLNGDVNINAPIYQYGNENEGEEPQRTETQPRAIDAERLKEYFVGSFLGYGNNIDFFSLFVHNLNYVTSNKEAAIVAKMVFDSKYKVTRFPTTFAKWYAIFCQLTGFKVVKGYKPNKLVATPRLQAMFGMLIS